MKFPPLSVIIPLAPDEQAWQALVEDLAALPTGSEIILVQTSKPSSTPALKLPGKTLRWVKSGPGRACALNTGAIYANHELLWFLHADSRLTSNTLSSLAKALQHYPNALLYFNLQFLGPRRLKLNASGAWLRSHWLKLPFGDQGFCLSRTEFIKLGGYPNDLTYGEDHIFIWRARACQLPIRCTQGTLLTSGRKYRQKGWLSTTVKHQYLWIKQALRWLTIDERRYSS